VILIYDKNDASIFMHFPYGFIDVAVV